MQFYTISELTLNIKSFIEENPELNSIWIKGEVSNVTYHSSGHIYFSLKDNNAVISATFFKYANKSMKFKLERGMSIFAFGSITLFEKRGAYQINVIQVKLEGVGELQKKIDELKKKLLKDGIFDDDKKKELPFLPKRVGVVTSPTGAAVQDIIKVALRRFPNIEIIIAPAKVQGADAAETIVYAIEELNRPKWNIDVIIAGRGGGSFEDLMPFNEEKTVMAFYNSKVPIISAVGHQIDHPLSDDAADAYAPTPSAAAELVIPKKSELINEINYIKSRVMRSVDTMINSFRNRLDLVKERRVFIEPGEIVSYREMLIIDLEKKISSSLKQKVLLEKNRLLSLPDINKSIEKIVANKTNEYNIALKSIEKLSPLSILRRGYNIAWNDNKVIIRSVDNIEKGDNIKLQLIDGSLNCIVDNKETGE